MREGAKPEIDPRLKSHWRALRLLSSLPAFLCGVALLGFVGLSLLPTLDSRTLGFVVIAGLSIIAALLSRLRRRVRERLLPELERASALLSSAPARPVRLKFLKIADLSGSYFAFRPEGSAPDSPVWRFVALRSDRKENFFQKEELQGELYFDQGTQFQDQGPLVAALVSGRGYWGKVVDAEALRAAWRAQRTSMSVALGVFVVALIALGVSGYNRVERLADARAVATESPNWPKTQGRITVSELVPARIARGKSTIAGYDARVSYVYFADGRHHEGWRVRPEATASADKARVEKILARYTEQALVELAYDPEDPERSTLESGDVERLDKELRNARLGFYIPLSFGVLACLVVSAIVNHIARASRRLLATLSGAES